MVIVFGSLNVDLVLPVEKIPTLGDTVLCRYYRLHAGGKGANQAVAAARAGAHVHMFGCVGKDSFRELLLRSLAESSVDIEGVHFTDQPTGCASICVDPQGDNVITVASGANLLADASLIKDELLSAQNIVVMQMEVPPEQNWALIKRAHQRGVKTILNLAPAYPIPEEILRILSILVLNKGEVEALGRTLNIQGSSSEIAQHITHTYGITCVVTLGSKGAFASSPEGTWRVEAMNIQAIDTTSAGDVFTGVLAATLDEGLSLEVALHRATVASGLACLTFGAQPSCPTKEQIHQALSTVSLPHKEK